MATTTSAIVVKRPDWPRRAPVNEVKSRRRRRDQNLLDVAGAAVLEVQRAVQQADAAFYSINPGGHRCTSTRSARARKMQCSRSRSRPAALPIVPDGEKDLERVFNEVAAELRGQYLLQYYSNSQAPGAQFRRIAVARAGPTRNFACALARATTRKQEVNQADYADDTVNRVQSAEMP